MFLSAHLHVNEKRGQWPWRLPTGEMFKIATRVFTVLVFILGSCMEVNPGEKPVTLSEHLVACYFRDTETIAKGTDGRRF